MSRIQFDLPELPTDWKWMNIADVVQKVANIKPELEPERKFRYIDISAIDNRAHKVSEMREFEGKDAPSRARRPVKTGDVLLSNVRVNLRNTAMVENGSADVCSTGFTVLRSNGKVTPNFLFRYVLSDQFVRPLEELQTGTQYPATSDRVVFEQLIPVPPIAVQAELDRTLTELEELVSSSSDRLATIPVLLKKFRQSVLAAACSGQLTEDWRDMNNVNSPPDLSLLKKAKGKQAAEQPVEIELPELPDCYAAVSVGEIVCLIQYGTSSKSGDDAPDRVPVLRMGNIQDGSLDWSNLKFADQDKEISSLILAPGDILFNRTNSPDLVGKTAVFRGDRTATFASYLIRLKVIPQLAVPEFVAYWINSAWGREWAQLAKTDGVSQSNINGTKLSVMPIPLPTIEEQVEIVRRVESLFALADSIESHLAEATAQVERTTQAILSKAFRGAL